MLGQEPFDAAKRQLHEFAADLDLGRVPGRKDQIAYVLASFEHGCDQLRRGEGRLRLRLSAVCGCGSSGIVILQATRRLVAPSYVREPGKGVSLGVLTYAVYEIFRDRACAVVIVM